MHDANLTSSSERIRIAHIVTTLNVGGLERVVLDLVRNCDRRRFDLRVFCLDQAGDLMPDFESTGVSPISLHASKLPVVARIWRLAGLLRKWRPHVLHSHNASPHFVGALAAQMAGVPVVVHTKHGRNYPGRRKAVLYNRIASRLSSCIVPVSRDAAEVALNVEKVPKRLVRVIHNGIDLEYFPARAEPAPELKNTLGRAIHVARLNWVKDQKTLLRGVRIAVDKRPDFVLDIVGDGPARDELESLRRELKLESHVNMLGMRSDVPAHLANADYFVLTSISEGISLTLLEAMASELPVIATDVGGNREVVDHELTGLLVPARDPEALAAAMLRVASDAALRQVWGQAGRARVTSDFNIRRAVESYQNLYLDLLAEKKRLPPSIHRDSVAASS